MEHIVVVEDNLSYAEDISDYLAKSGYGVRSVATAAALWQTLTSEHADAVVLDLGLPDEDGFTIIPKLRVLHPDCGVIVLTARVTLENRVKGLRLGADVFLTKPIKFPELVANIEAVCRRLPPGDKLKPPSPWRLSRVGRLIELDGKEAIPLTEKEFDLLHLLAQNRLPMSRESLLVGTNEVGDPAAIKRLDMLVYRLRKKIKAAWDVDLPLRSSYGGGFGLSVKMDLD